MNTTISRIKLFVIMFALWILFNFNFELPTLIFGVIISFVVTILSHNILYTESGFRYKKLKLTTLIIYLGVLFVEIFKSAFFFIRNLLIGGYHPTVFKMDLSLYDPVQVAIVANSITLTPGTITIDVVGHTIYVMVLAKPGTPQEELEAPIRQIFERLLKGIGDPK